jgi:hypothetical protein
MAMKAIAIPIVLIAFEVKDLIALSPVEFCLSPADLAVLQGKMHAATGPSQHC